MLGRPLSSPRSFASFVTLSREPREISHENLSAKSSVLATSSRGLVIAQLVALILLSLSVYGASLGYGFVWDDRPLIVENKAIQGWSNVPRALMGDFFEWSEEAGRRGYHRPLITLSYMADYSLWGMHPSGYHLTNVLFHAFSTVLVYLIAVRLLGDWPGPFVAAVLFAVHPVHTQSVAWISGRTDVIATTLVLLSLFLYLKARPRLSWGALLAFALALLAKEVAFVLPVILISCESLFDPPAWRERVRRILPFAVILGLYAFLRFSILGIAPANPFLLGQGRYRLLLTFAEALWMYGGKLLLPLNLSAYYSVPVAASLRDPAVLLSCLTLAAAGAMLWHFRRKEHAAVFSLLFVVIAILPVSNVIPVAAPKDMGFFMAERFLYLPSVGFCLVLGLTFSRAWRGFQGRWGQVLSGVVALALVVFYSAGTISHSQVWRDELTFYRATLTQAPFASLLHYNLGVAYKDLALFDLAEREWHEAVRLDPAFSQAHNDLGNVFALRGRADDALAEWAAAVEADPRNFQASFNLARALDTIGRLEEARHFYQRFLRSAPEDYLEARRVAQSRARQIDDLLSGSSGARAKQDSQR